MISIVLPVLNEQEVLPQLFERVQAAAATWGEDYEVVVVDDGSQDATWQLLEQLHREDERWKCLRLSRNFGHQAAVSAGIYYATGDAVIVMDADLQDPPEELGRFLAKWHEGYQVVYAIRTKRKENLLKRTAYAGFYRLLRAVANIDIPLDSGDFCVLDRSVVEVLKAMPERTRFVRGLRSWAGFRQIGVAYERQARQAGEVKYTLRRLMRLAFDGLLSFSSVPLRMASWLGISLCGVSVLVILTVVAWWATDIHVFGMRPAAAVGWTSLCSLLCLLSGLQMLVLGVIGEYLARMFDEVKGRPGWIIGEARGFGATGHQGQPGWFVAPLPRLRPNPAKQRQAA